MSIIVMEFPVNWRRGYEDLLSVVVHQALADKVENWHTTPPFGGCLFVDGDEAQSYFVSPEDMTETLFQEVGVIGVGEFTNLYLDIQDRLDGVPPRLRQQTGFVTMTFKPSSVALHMRFENATPH